MFDGHRYRHIVGIETGIQQKRYCDTYRTCVQFYRIKQWLLVLLQSEVKQKAEVAAFLKRFDEAERIYLDMDRRLVNCVYLLCT